MTDSKKLTVFYDGACPLCNREISFYKRRKGSKAVNWIDVNRSAKEELAPCLTKAQALSRFHVQTFDGRIISGGEAFAHVWAALPGFRFFGKFFQMQPFLWFLNNLYSVFLRFRPHLQRLFK